MTTIMPSEPCTPAPDASPSTPPIPPTPPEGPATPASLFKKYLQCTAAAYYILIRNNREDEAKSVAAAAKSFGGTRLWCHYRVEITNCIRCLRTLTDFDWDRIDDDVILTLRTHNQHEDDWRVAVGLLLDYAEEAGEQHAMLQAARSNPAEGPPPASPHPPRSTPAACVQPMSSLRYRGLDDEMAGSYRSGRFARSAATGRVMGLSREPKRHSREGGRQSREIGFFAKVGFLL